jgi:hypothetical protein
MLNNKTESAENREVVITRGHHREKEKGGVERQVEGSARGEHLPVIPILTEEKEART